MLGSCAPVDAWGAVGLVPVQWAEFRCGEKFARLEGAWGVAGKKTAVAFVHDDTIRIAFKRDFGTRWVNGVEQFSDRVRSYDVQVRSSTSRSRPTRVKRCGVV